MDAAALLAKAKRRIVAFDDPFFGERLHVRSLSVGEAAEMRDKMRDGESPEDLAENTAVQVACFLCDESGAPVFTLEQAREFCAGDFRASHQIVMEGNRLNTPTKSSIEETRGN